MTLEQEVKQFVELRKRGNMRSFTSLTLVGLVTLSLISSSEGYCNKLMVTGAYSYSGYYSLNDYYYDVGSCLGYEMWGDDYQYDMRYLHYISYRHNVQYPGGTTSGWVIRDYGCDDYGTKIWAFAPGYYSSPYYVPRGGWYQWSQYTNNLEYNNYMVIDCLYSNALSAWAITGIVIGCLCGVALIIGIIAVICSKKKKRTTSTPPRHNAPPPQAVYVTTNDYVTTVGVAGNPHTIDTIYSTPINPPAYDNSPPPAYVYNNSAV